MREHPPLLWRRLLRRLLPAGERDVVCGELLEAFRARCRAAGRASARMWYRRQVMGFVWRAIAVRRIKPEEEVEMGLFDDLSSDVRWAVRSVGRRPTFAAAAIGTLALGIGANSAIFTLVSAHFLTPLPYDRPSELALLWETGRNTMEVTTVAPGNYWSWREQAESFVDIAAYNVDFATLSGDGAAEQVTASLVAPHFFEVLGVPPMIGSGFDEASVRETGSRVVVLGHGLWTRRYGADPGIVGTEIRIDAQPHTVVGVMPRAFRQPERALTWQATELWRPTLLDDSKDNYGSRYLRTIARRKPDVTVEEAREEMSVLAAQLRAAFPEGNAGRSVLVRTLDDYLMGAARPTLLMLLAAGAAVLLIVCANVANLTLARGEERRREFAVRAALGSGAPRLLRQVVVEGIVLALAGAAVGTLVVFGGRDLLQVIQERFFSGLVDISVDWRVVGLTTAAAVVAGSLFGLPLARSAARPELRAALGSGNQRAGRRAGARATRSALIIGQVGLATTLLVVAALLSRSFDALVNVPPGFEPEGVVTFTVSAPQVSYPTVADVERYHRELLAEIERIPGVSEVGRVSDLPFTTENGWTSFIVAGRVYDPSDPPVAETHRVDAGYFSVMRIPLVAGEIPEGVRADGEIPIVVNAHMERWLWPGESALGARLDLPWDDTIPLRVAGVVGNILDDGYDAEVESAFFIPIESMPRRRLSYLLRTSGDPADVIARIRPAVSRIDPDVPASDLRLLEGMMAESVARPRAASLIGMTFALLALFVAAAGIYGVLSYSVQSRTHELGIRAALGASGKDLVSMVMGHSTGLVTVGLALGVGVSLVAGRVLSGLLFGVRTWDPPSLAFAVIVLGAVGTIAAWLPARRAVRIDPREALGTE